MEGRRKKSYKDSVMHSQGDVRMGDSDSETDDEFSNDDDDDDDDVEQDEDGLWIRLGMSKAEKKEARKPWRHNVIINVVSKKIGYHYLYSKLQAMWRLQTLFMLIDLTNDFFIVKLLTKQEQNMALFHGR